MIKDQAKTLLGKINRLRSSSRLLFSWSFPTSANIDTPVSMPSYKHGLTQTVTFVTCMSTAILIKYENTLVFFYLLVTQSFKFFFDVFVPHERICYDFLEKGKYSRYFVYTGDQTEWESETSWQILAVFSTFDFYYFTADRSKT